MTDPVPVAPTEPGVWMAHYWDGSAVIPFANEIECLRWAVSNSAAVVFVPFGTRLHEAATRDEAVTND